MHVSAALSWKIRKATDGPFNFRVVGPSLRPISMVNVFTDEKYHYISDTVNDVRMRSRASSFARLPSGDIQYAPAVSPLDKGIEKEVFDAKRRKTGRHPSNSAVCLLKLGRQGEDCTHDHLIRVDLRNIATGEPRQRLRVRRGEQTGKRVEDVIPREQRYCKVVWARVSEYTREHTHRFLGQGRCGTARAYTSQ